MCCSILFAPPWQEMFADAGDGFFGLWDDMDITTRTLSGTATTIHCMKIRSCKGPLLAHSSKQKPENEILNTRRRNPKQVFSGNRYSRIIAKKENHRAVR